MEQKIVFPQRLSSLLQGSRYAGPLRTYADQIGQVLAENQMPFFPDYTDHGINHINDVLASLVSLVPVSVWTLKCEGTEDSLLTAADAVVMIGATLLHDFAMHLRPAGFLDLISQGSRFKPLRWFDEEQVDHTGDRPWCELWEQYEREARRFSTVQLANIIGPKAAEDWKYRSLPDNPGEWETNHRLVIGEFLRRHHARLAHEIAMYGFPGSKAGEERSTFAALGHIGDELTNLADLIGLTARSHGMSLRVCASYLEAEYNFQDDLRPHGCAILYPMALLRVADYLQLDKKRAPAVLLQLHDPQSPVSVREWGNHAAVRISGTGRDQAAVFLRVAQNVPLPTYLQLQSLFAGLQREMDHSSAILSEYYGTKMNPQLNALRLEKTRVKSNLETPEFRKSLPYVPESTGFTADPQLLSLLVGPLYGDEPSVGVRELMQNAVDAVRELEEWCKVHNKDKKTLDLPEIDGDVSVEFIEQHKQNWILRVHDRGIGMRTDTIRNYFLRAGASFRSSPEWAKNFTNEIGKSKIIRTGQFGIGAFAIFLLGRSFKMWTRYADEPEGNYLEASETSRLIEIQRHASLKIGTKIEVQLDKEAAVMLLGDPKVDQWAPAIKLDQADWYRGIWPRLTISLLRLSGKVHQYSLHRPHPGPEDRNSSWSQTTWHASSTMPNPSKVESLVQKSGEAVLKKEMEIHWEIIDDDNPILSVNGFVIRPPRSSFRRVDPINWSNTRLPIRSPTVAIVDKHGLLDLTITRYELRTPHIGMLEALSEDVVLSFIAYALVAGPKNREQAFSLSIYHPMFLHQFDHERLFSEDMPPGFDLIWTATHSAFVPADSFLLKLLGNQRINVFGTLWDSTPEALQEELVIPLLLSGESSVLVYTGVGPHRKAGSRSVNGRELINELRLRLCIQGVSRLISLAIVLQSRDRLVRSDSWRAGPMLDGFRQSWIFAEGVGEASNPAIEKFLGSTEKSKKLQAPRRRRGRTRGIPLISFFSELEFELTGKPTSLIARLWEQTLGHQAIPFDPVARAAMITRSLDHPRLGRHVRAWQELEAEGSFLLKR